MGEKMEYKVIKPFNLATKAEIEYYLFLHYYNKINLADYWNDGDMRVEPNGASYVILDFNKVPMFERVNGFDKSAVTIMRTDLSSLRMPLFSYNTIDKQYDDSIISNFLYYNGDLILGETFNDLYKMRRMDDGAANSVWIPSLSEVCGNDDLPDDVYEEGDQLKFFETEGNRLICANWWTRTQSNSKEPGNDYYYYDVYDGFWSDSASEPYHILPCFSI